MGRTSPIASFAVILLLLSAGSAAHSQSETNASKSVGASVADNYFFSAGMGYWQENFQLAGPDQTYHNITAVNWALALGVQRQIQRAYWGWLFDFQALVGQNQDQSTDPALVYFNNRQSLFGGVGGFGLDYQFDPGVRLGLEACVLYRHIAMSAPAGYSLSRFADTFDTLLRLELTLPITREILAVQQFGYSPVSQDILWVIGVRI